MTPHILSAQDLTKSYGQGENRFDALKGVNLSVDAGESLAIVGKSGSGKSTLMHLLALLDTPDGGTITVKGQDARSLGKNELNELRNRDFGFVFQQFFLTPNSSVLDNVVLPLMIAGVKPAERKKRGMEALERLEMADKARNRATDLSGGQKQRVVIGEQPVGDLRR
jgi:putative ABC transport system ATP-binding protein